MSQAAGGPGAPRRSARAKTRNVARRDVDPARVCAWRVLRAVDEDDAYANLVLPGLLREMGLRGRDAAFATELAYGALRGRGTYDAVLARCVDRPLSEVDGAVLDALRLGAHQLFGMRVAAHAAVASTVDLVRSEIGQGAAGFANAVLRRVSRQDLSGWLAEIAPDRADDPEGYLAVVHSHPAWIVRAFGDALALRGRDRSELAALLEADNARPAVALAALPGLADPADLLRNGGTPGSLSPVAVTISGAPQQVPQVRSGAARVQDEGSQLVALALTRAPLVGPDTGQWLDLCAGPGGKTALLAAVLSQSVLSQSVLSQSVLSQPGGPRPRLVAVEVQPHRAELVRRSTAAPARRVDLQVRTQDGRDVGRSEPGAYDRVLVDAPCTGLGALRRRPEARWRRSATDLADLGQLQRSLLASALDAVRPGGVVAYVTCSPHVAETGVVVRDVLRRRGDVEQLDAQVVLVEASGGSLNVEDLGQGPDAQLWPHVHGSDAMYLALLRRTG